MMNELTRVVAHTAHLSPAQAETAVKAVLHFFTARLPSRLVGELHAYLKTPVVTVPPTPLPSLEKSQIGKNE